MMRLDGGVDPAGKASRMNLAERLRVYGTAPAVACECTTAKVVRKRKKAPAPPAVHPMFSPDVALGMLPPVEPATDRGEPEPAPEPEPEPET